MNVNAMTMVQTQASAIPWRRIDTMPPDRLDGRDVLLWVGHLAVCSWCGEWLDAVGRPVRDVAFWADVGEPGE